MSRARLRGNDFRSHLAGVITEIAVTLFIFLIALLVIVVLGWLVR